MASTFSTGLLAASSVGVLISLLYGLRISHSISTPLREAAEVAKSFSGGLLSARVRCASNDEIGILASAMNSSFQELQQIVLQVSTVLAKIEQGDLSADLRQDFKGDFKPISDALNSILNRLNEIFNSFQTISSNVDSEAGMVSQGVKEAAKGAEEQTVSVRRLLKLTEQSSDASQKNVREIEQTAALIGAVTGRVQENNNQMQDMLSAIGEISRSSEQIEKITQIINHIATQTNLLALNAAVEAARAGQAGDGFSVVAGEVRRLAVQVNNSAKQISMWIQNSTVKITEGFGIASEAAQSLHETSDAMGTIHENITRLDQSVRDQSSVFQQMTQSTEQITRVIQENSHVAGQQAEASAHLFSHSSLLAKQLGSIVLRNS